MTNLVYRAAKNSSALAFEATTNTGGTVYPLTLVTNGQQSVATLSITKIVHLSLSVLQQSEVQLTKQYSITPTVTQTSVVDLYTDTQLNGALATVLQNSVAWVPKQVQIPITATQNSTASLDTQVIRGDTVTTYHFTFLTNQASVVSVNKNIQTIKTATMQSVASLETLVTESFNGVPGTASIVLTGGTPTFASFFGVVAAPAQIVMTTAVPRASWQRAANGPRQVIFGFKF